MLSAVMNFGLTVALKEADAQVGVTNSPPVTFSAAWEPSVTAHAFGGHSSLHQAFASVSQRKTPLAELPEVCWAGSCSCHYLHSAHWMSTPVTGGGLCPSLYPVFIARPAWPLQACSFLPLCLHSVFFALFVGLWGTFIKLHVLCWRSTRKDAKGFHKAWDR